MEKFVYFVRLRLLRELPLLAFLRGEHPFPAFETTVTIDFPVLDNGDLASLKKSAMRAVFGEEAEKMNPNRVALLTVSFLSSYHTKSFDKYIRGKERAREDAERGHSSWWSGNPQAE